MADEIPPEIPEEEPTTAAVVEEQQQEVPSTQEETPDEEQHYIRIDKRNYAGELSRLEREDNHFKEVFRARIGQRAARVYKPQIEELQHRYTSLQQQQAQAQFESWKKNNPQQFQQELANNPQFARQYAEVQQAPNPALVQLEAFLGNELTQAIENGLPDEKAEELYNEVFTGKYNQNPDGTPISIPQFAQMFRANVFKATLEANKGTTAPVQTNGVTQATPQQPNPALASGAPVGSGNRGRPSTKYTKEQILDWQATDPERFMREFKSDEDFENAVNSGQILGMGPNS